MKTLLRRLLLVFLGLAVLIAAFYTEEDWRGKRAWENCKRELEAKGAVLGWDKFIPPPVPDDQNFFKASKKIAFSFVHSRNYGEADLYAKQPRIQLGPTESNSFPILDTAKTRSIAVALLTVIPPGSATFKSTGNRLVLQFNDPAARSKAGQLIQNTIGRSANGSQGFKFSEFQLTNLNPTQIILLADPPPSVAELENLMSADTVTNIGHLRVEATGDKGKFQVSLTEVRITAAADYLKWSDQYEPDFEEIREALKRPYAQIDCDYSQPDEVQVPNFVTMRWLAQTLAQRTQCYLLLGQPEALRELTLLNDSRRILEGGPTGKPMTLVAAMINVAIAGVYVDTVAYGLQLHAWHEPQLAMVQEQLEQINLPLFVVQAFESEPAATTHTLETTPTLKLKEWFQVNVPGSKGSKISPWQKMKNLKWMLMPRGWIYQNMATSAKLVYEQAEGFDSATDIIQPQKFADLTPEMNAIAKPYKFIAAESIPNFTRAWQTTAHNQTMANEAQIACALERCRLAHGEYPETLDALAPQFIEKLPHDIIGGQPLHYRRTDPPSQSSGAASGNFLLYSVGWNEKDDGGQVALKADGSVDLEKGDWVWKN